MAQLPRIGFLGLGAMGSPMAARLAAAGYPVTVYNRAAAKAAPLVRAGARAAATPAAAAREADVVITVVTDDAAVRAVTGGVDGALRGARPGVTFIDCSTIAPATTRELARQAAAIGCHWLDAPVLGGPAAAAAGTLPFVVGGDRLILQQHEAILRALGSTIQWMGDTGMGQAAKIVHNAVCGILLAGIGEAVVLGEGLGLTRQQILEVLAAGAIRSPLLEAKTPKYLSRDFTPSFTLANMGKDLHLAIAAAGGAGLTVPVLGLVAQRYAEAMAQGLGQLDSSAIIELIERRGANAADHPRPTRRP